MEGQESPSPSFLLGQLSDEFSRLVRYDLELAAAERIPAVHEAALDGAVLAGAIVAACFGLAGLSWAAVAGLEHVISAWASPLVVAGVWALVAAGLLASRRSRRLLARASVERSRKGVETTRAARAEAEREIRATAEQFAEAVLREAPAQGAAAAEWLVERGVGNVKQDVRRLFSELSDVLRASGKTRFGFADPASSTSTSSRGSPACLRRTCGCIAGARSACRGSPA